MTDRRICARDGCHQPMDHRRSGTVYCSGACRTAGHRAKHAERAKAQTKRDKP